MSVSLLVSNVQVTGSNVIYKANFSGIGGTIVVQSGNNVLISGGAGGGGSVTQGQLDSLSGFTTGISGYLQQQIAMASAGVVSLNGLSGALNLAGTGGISIRQAGSTIFISGNNWITSGDLNAYSGWANLTYATITTTNTISGNLGLTGQTLYNLITTNSGLFVPTGTMLSYLTGVATGWDTGYYSFLNYTFATIPRVEVTMELSGTNTLYGFAISGRSTSGFYVNYTDIISESGISLNVLAKN